MASARVAATTKVTPVGLWPTSAPERAGMGAVVLVRESLARCAVHNTSAITATLVYGWPRHYAGLQLRLAPSTGHPPEAGRRARRARNQRLQDLRAAARAKAPASDHDQRRHDHKKWNGRVVHRMSGCRDHDRNASPERERKQQGPSARNDHPSSQGDRQDQDDGHGQKNATDSQPRPVRQLLRDATARTAT